jgi:hypothetical protein
MSLIVRVVPALVTEPVNEKVDQEPDLRGEMAPVVIQQKNRPGLEMVIRKHFNEAA